MLRKFANDFFRNFTPFLSFLYNYLSPLRLYSSCPAATGPADATTTIVECAPSGALALALELLPHALLSLICIYLWCDISTTEKSVQLKLKKLLPASANRRCASRHTRYRTPCQHYSSNTPAPVRSRSPPAQTTTVYRLRLCSKYVYNIIIFTLIFC